MEKIEILYEIRSVGLMDSYENNPFTVDFGVSLINYLAFHIVLDFPRFHLRIGSS